VQVQVEEHHGRPQQEAQDLKGAALVVSSVLYFIFIFLSFFLTRFLGVS
jgi:hypothetical protein